MKWKRIRSKRNPANYSSLMIAPRTFNHIHTCRSVFACYRDKLIIVSMYTRTVEPPETPNKGNDEQMKSTKVQTSPIILHRSHALEHLPQSTEPGAVLGSKYVMAKPTQFVKLSER